MTEQNRSESNFNDVPEAVVHRKKHFSIVWLVPVVALLIGGWLAFKALSEKGPVITITFETAEGLEAGKTKIKYKDVEVGLVESIDVSDDLSHVIVTAELSKRSKPYLTEDTRFWVVRARVAAGEVSGLGTLFSGRKCPGWKNRGEEMASYDTIRVERDHKVAIVTLNRPEKLNAWSWTLQAEVIAAFDAADADDDVRAIVVTGAGRAFCAGADLDDVTHSVETTGCHVWTCRGRPRV